MLNVIGWTLYIGCIIYTISGILYSRQQIKIRGSVSYTNLTWLFFTLSISIAFAFISYNKINLLWIIPICLIIGITPLSKILGTFMTNLTLFIFRSNSYSHITNNKIQKSDLEQKLKPNPDIKYKDIDKYYESARVQYKLEDFKGAKKYFDKVIEINSSFAEAYIDRGLTNTRLGDFKSAFIDYTKAIELKHNDSQTYMKRGCTSALFNDHKGAINDFSKAIELNSEFAEAYFQRGLMYWVLQDKQMAFQDWEIAKKLGNNDAKEMLKK